MPRAWPPARTGSKVRARRLQGATQGTRRKRTRLHWMMAARQAAKTSRPMPIDGKPIGTGESAERARQVPVRRCLASGERLPQDRLIRFVVGPDKEVVPDLAGRLPGRGLWIRCERALLEKAIARGLFARAARTAVQVPPDLPERVGLALRRRCQDWLGMARRGGVALA